jgi:hypothetical protein
MIEIKSKEYDVPMYSWTVELQQDGEDLILQFTDEMLEVTGWQLGDELLWEHAIGDAWILRKKP